MSDLWEDEGFGSGGATLDAHGDDWDEGEESLESTVEDGLDDPDEVGTDDLDDDS